MARILISLCLLVAFAIWMAEKKFRRFFGLPSGDNCATWAADNFDYAGGDGLVLHRTVSNSKIRFPHVVIMRGARKSERKAIELIEFVPKVRLANKQLPARHFDGIVKRRSYIVVDHPHSENPTGVASR